MLLWLQGCIVPFGGVILARYDLATGLGCIVAGEVMAILACGWSLACGHLRGRGALLYAPTAAGTVGLVAVWLAT